MKNLNKLRGRGGINRLSVILLVLVIALLALFSVPIYRWYRTRADAYGCTLALKKAQDLLDEEYMLKGFQEHSSEEAKAVVDRSLMGRDELCPGGGDYYIVRQPGREPAVRVVCGVHEEDKKLKTRLAAYNVLEQLQAEYGRQRQLKNPDPAEIAVTLNGQELPIQLVDKKPALKRGTYVTPGFEGTVSFYMTDSRGVCYFCFADPDYCAFWQFGKGWGGDSYDT